MFPERQPVSSHIDAELQTRIGVALALKQRSSLVGIRFHVCDRVATLWGEVPSFFDRQIAVEAVKKVTGLRQVRDELTVAVHQRAGFTLPELLVVLAVIGLLSSLLLPAVQAVRESGRRTQCVNNLKQLALAVQSFHDAHGHLPASIRPSGLTAAARTSGLTLLLPFVERGDLYERYDLSRSWNEPENRDVVRTRVPLFQCPSTPQAERLDGIPEQTPWTDDIAGVTDYSPTTGVDIRLKSADLVDAVGVGLISKNGRPTFADVTDGLSNTFLFAESAGRPRLIRRGTLEVGAMQTTRVNGGGWARPASDFSVDGSSRDGGVVPGPWAINCTNGEDVGPVFPHPYYGTEGTGETFAFHASGANIAFGDGSVRLLDEDIDIREFARLVTRSEGEPCLGSH